MIQLLQVLNLALKGAQPRRPEYLYGRSCSLRVLG